MSLNRNEQYFVSQYGMLDKNLYQETVLFGSVSRVTVPDLSDHVNIHRVRH